VPQYMVSLSNKLACWCLRSNYTPCYKQFHTQSM